ncbi:hypothetical protein C8T65DRAFT_81843 [Cerioporus squamosus]|nr:hypothetical protein C8T65DRAFT_81843 [Cerioporus squamosus]
MPDTEASSRSCVHSHPAQNLRMRHPPLCRPLRPRRVLTTHRSHTDLQSATGRSTSSQHRRPPSPVRCPVNGERKVSGPRRATPTPTHIPLRRSRQHARDSGVAYMAVNVHIRVFDG